MKQIRALSVVALALVLVAAAAAATPSRRVRISPLSQQFNRASAGISAGIVIDTHEPGHHHASAAATGSRQGYVGGGETRPPLGGATSPLPKAVYPTLPSSSSLLKNQHPGGAGSFWYQDGSGHACEYIPDSSGLCFTVTGTADGGTTIAPLAPAAVAEQIVNRLTLTPGRLEASPDGAGLTGAASWFWLDPAPTTQRLSALLAGEAVTVTATPQVLWRFGDGTSVTGGAGVPYRTGAMPSAAVTHVYQVRCLPGDQGHDPDVLASCGSDGYELEAAVSWQISYAATGPVGASGDLPSRTTTSSASYPVSEVRAFLTGAAG